MTDREAFLAAIIVNPDDDAPRLEFSDWLLENGEEEYGEFIRVQIAIGELEKGTREYPAYIGPKIVTVPPQLPDLHRREEELLLAPSGNGDWTNYATWFDPFRHECQTFSYRRGFVCAIICTAADWLAHADAILAVQPVEEVTLTTWPQANVDRLRTMREWRRPSYLGQTPAMWLEAEWPRIKKWSLPPVLQGMTNVYGGYYINRQ